MPDKKTVGLGFVPSLPLRSGWTREVDAQYPWHLRRRRHPRHSRLQVEASHRSADQRGPGRDRSLRQAPPTSRLKRYTYGQVDVLSFLFYIDSICCAKMEWPPSSKKLGSCKKVRGKRLGRTDAHTLASRVCVPVIFVVADEDLLLVRKRIAASGKGNEGLSVLPFGP